MSATAPPSTEPTIRQEPSLDGIRGVAVAGVIIYHGAALVDGSRLLTGGFLGVSVFFVVSGYLMTSLLLAEHERTGTIAIARFAARRVRRLTPASLAVVVGAIVLALPGWAAWKGFHATDALAGIWGVMNWHVIRLGSAQVIRGIGPVGPYWSLAVELQFYLALALVCIPMRRSAQPRRWLWGFAVVAWIIGAASQLFGGGSDIHREFGTDYRIAELATGMVLALTLGASHRRTEPAGSRSMLALGGVATAAILAGFLWADFTPPWLLAGGFLIVAVVSAGLVHAVLASTFWQAVFSWRPLVWVGTLSYSIYLVHWPVGMLLARHLATRGVGALAINLIAVTAVAFVLNRFVETPLRHWSARPRTVLLAGLGVSAAASLLALAVLP